MSTSSGLVSQLYSQQVLTCILNSSQFSSISFIFSSIFNRPRLDKPARPITRPDCIYLSNQTCIRIQIVGRKLALPSLTSLTASLSKFINFVLSFSFASNFSPEREHSSHLKKL